MFLSQLLLNARSRQVQRELVSPYEMHRTLLRAFPDGLALGSEEAAERLLYRLDALPDDHPFVLVQSRLQPDWTRLAEGYLVAPARMKAVEPVLVRGQMLAFRLHANPTKRLGKSHAEGGGKRVGLYAEEERIAWLERKFAAAGLRLAQVLLNDQGVVGGRTRAHAGGARHDLTLSGVRFDGRLLVADPDAALRALADGIGSGKAFGFGLLSLGPAE